MNLNELIKKYEEKIKYNNRIQQKLIDECQVYAFDLANDNEICEEILSYLEQLKEKTNNIEERIYFTDRELVAVNVVKKEIIGE